MTLTLDHKLYLSRHACRTSGSAAMSAIARPGMRARGRSVVILRPPPRRYCRRQPRQ